MNKTHFSKEYFVFLLKTERTRGSLIKSYLSNVAAEAGMTADGREHYGVRAVNNSPFPKFCFLAILPSKKC